MTAVELLAPSSPTDDTPIQTLESLAASRKSKDAPSNLSSSSQVSPESSPQTPLIDNPLSTDEAEQEASQQGAFNEETGEINWDCPCLGGMAHGPCGEEFRAAFSCFIYSKEEPKGMECIENFKYVLHFYSLRCFRYPDVLRLESYKQMLIHAFSIIGACKTVSVNIPKSTVVNSKTAMVMRAM